MECSHYHLQLHELRTTSLCAYNALIAHYSLYLVDPNLSFRLNLVRSSSILVLASTVLVD